MKRCSPVTKHGTSIAAPQSRELVPDGDGLENKDVVISTQG